MSLPGYDAWLERPYTDACHDCPGDPDDCHCAEDAEDARDAALIQRQDAEDGR